MEVIVTIVSKLGCNLRGFTTYLYWGYNLVSKYQQDIPSAVTQNQPPHKPDKSRVSEAIIQEPIADLKSTDRRLPRRQ